MYAIIGYHEDGRSALYIGTLIKLVLDECGIDPYNLQRVTADIAALQEFSFNPDPEAVEPRFYLPEKNFAPVEQPREIVQYLLQSASYSLVSLDLTNYKSLYSEDTNQCYFIGSLKGFEILQRLRINYRKFVENRRIHWVQDFRTHRMVDMIPTSVVTVTLAGPILFLR